MANRLGKATPQGDRSGLETGATPVLLPGYGFGWQLTVGNGRRHACSADAGAKHRKKIASRRQRHYLAADILVGMKKVCFNLLLGGSLAALAGGRGMAEDSVAPDARFGLFNGLDSRSSYGQGIFPEPFLVDDSDLEAGELRFDWLRTAVGGAHRDNVKGEVEYGIGLMTLEMEVPYEHDESGGETSEGFGNIDVGARYPLYQIVSGGAGADTTFGAAVELGIPTTSKVSHNTEFVPKIFNDLRISRFTLQSIAGYSMLFGPGSDGGVNTFEYGFTFGYTIPRQTLPLPGVEQIIPVFELSGETQLNRENAGQTSLIGDAGLRVNLQTIGRIQPRPGIVLVFPLNQAARQETRWGIMTSLVFEF